MRNNHHLLPQPTQIREFDGDEVELKLQVANLNPAILNYELQSRIDKGSLRGFSLYPPRINQHWIFYFDYYGYKENSIIKQSYHLVHFPGFGRHWFRKKQSVPLECTADGKTLQSFLLRRKQYTIEKNVDLNTQLAEKYLKLELESSTKKIVFLGRVKREKFYFYILNQKTQRHYSISLDECQADHRKMHQLEVEYKWKLAEKGEVQGSASSDNTDIFSDFLRIVSFLQQNYSNHLSLTRLTKFEWLCQGENY